MEIQTVSDSEFILMRIIWESGNTALYADIFEELAKKELQWKKNTIITLLSRLVDKGLLKTNKIGRKNKYIALISEEEYNASKTKDFVNHIYEGSVSNLVSTLINADLITSKEKELLLNYWNEEKEHE